MHFFANASFFYEIFVFLENYQYFLGFQKKKMNRPKSR